MPDAKRPRTAAPAHVAAGENGAHYAPERRDPARDAIVNSRERKAHEVLARMLTTLHSEAVAHEQRAPPLASLCESSRVTFGEA